MLSGAAGILETESSQLCSRETRKFTGEFWERRWNSTAEAFVILTANLIYRYSAKQNTTRAEQFRQNVERDAAQSRAKLNGDDS